MSNEDFDKKLKTLNANLTLSKKLSEGEKRLFDAYKFLVETEEKINV